ncbi:helix-turn-helix domain-containing protein [Enterococcus rivorum]|uniref:Mga helix-turn-helix domain-containing protein n=1 Tax=Enterococcus rivorum TaxID=762845 RepID=A0A1E5L0I3_9ENTE|nr:helix-turn-helix domain-containing protein [Enterococcus rivorum]MBP2098477.1 hypothetical protein [Enterococcus rivorum]OEH83672.1 hypothetical protein BCR26_08370 [Enterococcus rivorum]
MNEIGYKLIVDKRVKRRIDIVTLLLKAKQPKPITYLSKMCHSTDKTVSSEIKTINELLPNEIKIISKEFEGVYLIADNPFLLSGFISDQLDGNPLYEIIESIFLSEEKTLEDFSIETFISESTIRSYLNTLKKVLKEYSLSLRIKPFINIVGNEADIRFFFFQYFRHAHDSASILAETEQLAAVHNTITQLTKDFGLKLNLDYYRISHWLLIIEQRILTGHPIKLPIELLEKHEATFNFKNVKSAFYQQFSGLPLGSISEEEFLFAFIVRLDGVIYEESTPFYMKDYKNYLAEFEPLIFYFFSENGLLPYVNADLRVMLQAFLVNTMFLSDITPGFQRVSSAIQQYVQSNYPEILNQWITTLTKNLMPNYLHVKYPLDLATSLTLITVAYIERYTTKKRNILFSLTGTPSSLNYFKTQLLNILPNGVNAHFIFNKPLTNSLLDALEIDTCVYNYHIDEPITYCQSLRMSNIPTETEWLELVPNLLSKINTKAKRE